MTNDLVNKTENDFESIKHIDENGVEFWYARELMIMLEYSKWGNFTKVIDKAKESCKNSNINALEHFADVGKTSKMPNGGKKIIDDFQLTRYACYLIAQNGDARKKTIALAQTYFAVQTRKQELTRQEYEQLSEDDACITHHNVGQAVRQTIKRIGGTMPEDLPTPSKSTKEIEKEKEKKKKLKFNDRKKLKQQDK